MTLLEFQHKLVDLNLKRTQLAREIEKRFNEKLSSSELNKIMRGFQRGNKAERIKSEVEQILTEMEEGGESK